MQTKCQGHNISRLLSWVLFYPVSLLFKQHRKSRKCNINFYMAFIFIPMELFKIHRFFSFGEKEGQHIILYAASQSHICGGLLEEKQRWWVFCWVWSHCVFCSKWCDNGHDVGVDLTTQKERWEEGLHRTRQLPWEKKKHGHTWTDGHLPWENKTAKHASLGICIFTKWKCSKIKMRCTTYLYIQKELNEKDGLSKKERRRYISLNLSFGISKNYMRPIFIYERSLI